MQWVIYGLVDPRTKLVRYVGWSTNSFVRYDQHITLAKKKKSHKCHWIMELLRVGVRPKLRILERGSGDGWGDVEKKWVSFFRQQCIANGVTLTNATNGGEGTPGYCPPKEVRDKMRKAQLGRKQSKESIEKTRRALLGRKQSPEHVAKLSLARKGKAPMAATIAAAKANRGRKQTRKHVEARISKIRGVGRPAHRRFSDEEIRDIRRGQITSSLTKLSAKYKAGITTIHSIWHRHIYADVK